ncbi:MAG: terephthalate dihydrodiol dehydrogenase [Xanthobacteraceae bacterium]|nr:terephthalate dihydrodiol dehydrogenase [Xanthobacteraceae bacterium]
MSGRIKIAIPVGDPAGIGPEISLKAALDPAVRAACDPILVCDPDLLARHARACGIKINPSQIDVLACPQPETASLGFGVVSPISGRASVAFCAAAVKAAMAGEVDAVVAAPQHETSIAQAGIAFDGHPSFVAQQTGADESGVYMMLCFGHTRIAHCTLHRSVREALALITRESVSRTIRAANATLQRIGIAAPKIAVSGLNPHAGEGGLFGREEIETIKPAMDAVTAEGLNVSGPFGADTMFHMPGFDAFVVMLHDQGHIAAKLLAQNAAAALTIGTPILFASVAHGTGHDIAGQGIANPAAMIEAVLMMAKAKQTNVVPAKAGTQ